MAAKPLRLKAARLQREGDLAGAFKAYEEAVALAPDDPELLTALAELAGQLEKNDLAVGLWAHVSRVDPTGRQTADGYARALITAARFSDAIDVLKSALRSHPGEPRLWATLGLALTYAGRAAEALTFFGEAIRLDPRSAPTLYNRGLALCDLGRLPEAEADFQTAGALARKPSERATIEFSLATLVLARGDLPSGWSLYERRLSPDWPRSVLFQGMGRRLVRGDALVGRNVLVLAEQGVSDEIMFANLLPDLIDEIGPEGRLVIAVDARLVDLFQRSFPSIEVCAHATPRVGTRAARRAKEAISGRIDLWTPLGSLAQRYRQTIIDFPRSQYLRPDPARIAHWRAWLGGDRPAFGLTWRSGKMAGERKRLAPPLQPWTNLLRMPGVQFVNIQYGDCAPDLALLTQMSGVELRQPLGLDIREDLDDLAALCAALDGVVGIQNATSVLAGACGAPVAFVTGPGSWFHLGQQRPPWFAEARMCEANDFADWTPAISAAAAEMSRIVDTHAARRSPAGPVAITSETDSKPEGDALLAGPKRQGRKGPSRGALSVVCVLRSGADYSPLHVARLQRQLAKHLPGAELTCLSDVDVPCRRIALRQDWSGVRGWWAKMELFAPWVEGDLLFFDLDTSLVGDLSEIAAVRSLTMLEDFNFSGYASSGVMFLPEADRQPIWEAFSRDPMRWVHHYDNPNLENARWGDQGFLSDHGLYAARRWQNVVPGQIVSYKVHELARRGMPPNARVICFHGTPRPWAPEVSPEFQGD